MINEKEITNLKEDIARLKTSCIILKAAAGSGHPSVAYAEYMAVLSAKQSELKKIDNEKDKES